MLKIKMMKRIKNKKTENVDEDGKKVEENKEENKEDENVIENKNDKNEAEE